MRDVDWQIINTLYVERNITKTANLLFLTQPALTKRVQQIEEEFGAALIIRSTKGIEFTPEGEYVAQCAKEILKLIEGAKAHIAEENRLDRGVLRLGVPNSCARFSLPALVESYAALHPGVQLDITTMLSHEILALVESRSLQVGIVRGECHTKLERLMISEDQIHVVSRGKIDLADLPHLPQIDYTKEPSVIRATERWWRERFDQPPIIRMRVNHGDTCREMIANNLGYGIFSDAKFVANYPELTAVPLYFKDGSAFTRKTWMVYPEEELKKRVVQDFVQLVEKLNCGK